MIVDLQKFLAAERACWLELEAQLDRLAGDPSLQFSLHELQRFHYLYQRASADLAKLMTFAAEPESQQYVSDLVARAYAEVHEVRQSSGLNWRRLWRWFFYGFPRTLQAHPKALRLSCMATLIGCLFGGMIIAFDPPSKAVLFPPQFAHLYADPDERVAQEESQTENRLQGHQGQFSAMLMTHNTRVAINILALGMTFGLGSLVLLFYNGVILGGVCIDYVLAGQSAFLAGWLLPHGAVEIPAILIAGQASLVLASALIGWGNRKRLRLRLRQVTPDLVSLIGGLSLMLVWAGVVESFFSQYHEPGLPYPIKIAFGLAELAALGWFLFRRLPEPPSSENHRHAA